MTSNRTIDNVIDRCGKKVPLTAFKLAQDVEDLKQSVVAAQTAADGAAAEAAEASATITAALEDIMAAKTATEGYAGAASASATEASESATSASAYATAAETSAGSAADSATSAGSSAGLAANSATAASNSADSASSSASNAATSANSASGFATAAANSANSASSSATAAAGSVTSASAYATEAKSYAKGDTSSRVGEDTDNAYFYKGQAATSASASASSALESEGWAVGKQNGSAVTSGSDYYQNNAKYYAETAKFDAEAWAKGTRNGVAVGSSDDEYHNNAKYYAEVAESASQDNMAPAFSSSTAYSEGDYVIYNKNLYQFTADHSAGAWTGSDAQSVTISSEIGELTNSISKLSAFVTPEMYGAVGDGETDDTEAVQSAFTNALLYKVGVLGSGNYLITDTITVTNSSTQDNKVVEITGKLISNFSNKPVIIFDHCEGWKINVNAISSDDTNYFGGYDFSGSNYHYGALPYVGVVLRNANRVEFSGFLRNFNVGLRIEGLSGGSVYNFIHGVSVWNCAYGIELYANTSGWVNNNRFNSNTVSVNSGITNRNKAVAVHIFSSYNYANNCNLFEGDYMSADGYPSLLIENGQYNEFFFRNEGLNTVTIDNGSFNTFYTNKYDQTEIAFSGGNISENAMTKLINSFEKVVDLDSDNVDIVAWKTSGNWWAKGGNIVDYGNYQSSAFKTIWYGEQTPVLDGIPTHLGAFIDIKGLGTIATYCESYTANEDVRIRIYLFDSSRTLLDPTNYYLGSFVGGTMTIDTSNMRLQNASNQNGTLNTQMFKADVRYIFVTGNKNLKRLVVYAKKTNKLIPCISHFDVNAAYPYFELNNTNIKTSKPRKGKRLYSTVDGAEYICTAVSNGEETWTKKSI